MGRSSELACGVAAVHGTHDAGVSDWAEGTSKGHGPSSRDAH